MNPDRARVVSLEVVRATRDEPHVRVEVAAWHLGRGRWWHEPTTLSRMGDLTPSGWLVLADMLDEYARDLRRYAGATEVRPVHRRRHRVRRA